MTEKKYSTAWLWTFAIFWMGMINLAIWMVFLVFSRKYMVVNLYLNKLGLWVLPAFLLTWLILVLAIRLLGRKEFDLEAKHGSIRPGHHDVL